MHWSLHIVRPHLTHCVHPFGIFNPTTICERRWVVEAGNIEPDNGSCSIFLTVQDPLKCSVRPARCQCCSLSLALLMRSRSSSTGGTDGRTDGEVLESCTCLAIIPSKAASRTAKYMAASQAEGTGWTLASGGDDLSALCDLRLLSASEDPCVPGWVSLLTKVTFWKPTPSRQLP